MELSVTSYLELGVHENETMSSMPDACGPAASLVGVDVREPGARVPGVHYRIMSTGEYFEEWAHRDGPFDMVFIDADHSARAVLTDFEAVWPHVTPEGLVLLHDVNPETIEDTQPGYCGDAWSVAKYLHDTNYEITVLPYHPGLAIIRKRASWGPVGPKAAPRLTAGKEPHAPLHG